MYGTMLLFKIKPYQTLRHLKVYNIELAAEPKTPMNTYMKKSYISDDPSHTALDHEAGGCEIDSWFCGPGTSKAYITCAQSLVYVCCLTNVFTTVFLCEHWRCPSS